MKKIIFFSISILIFFSCSKKEEEAIENSKIYGTWPVPQICHIEDFINTFTINLVRNLGDIIPYESISYRELDTIPCVSHDHAFRYEEWKNKGKLEIEEIEFSKFYVMNREFMKFKFYGGIYYDNENDGIIEVTEDIVYATTELHGKIELLHLDDYTLTLEVSNELIDESEYSTDSDTFSVSFAKTYPNPLEIDYNGETLKIMFGELKGITIYKKFDDEWIKWCSLGI